MPDFNKKTVSSANATPVSEMLDWYERNKSAVERYMQIQQINDVSKKSTNHYKDIEITKNSIRIALKNPERKTKELRNISRKLYIHSAAYRKIISYYAGMIDISLRTIIPAYSIKRNKKADIERQFYETAKFLDETNLSIELIKAYIVCWREDVFYGCVKHDTDGSFHILQMPFEYCAVTGAYTQFGDLSFAINMSYFDQNPEYLGYWGEPFEGMYKAYKNDKKNKLWQLMPDENAICLKVNIDDPTIPIPPLSGLFMSITDLQGLEEIQAIAAEQGVYQLFLFKNPLLGAKDRIDDFAVNRTTAARDIQDIQSILPDYADVALINALDLEVIESAKDNQQDANKVLTATKTLFNLSGGSQVLNSATIASQSGLSAALKLDTKFGLATLLPQTQAWLNRFLHYKMKKPARVKLLNESTYTKDFLKDTLLKELQYGFPNMFLLNAINGISEMETLTLNYLEQDCFRLSDKFKPPQSSHTQTTEAGRPSAADSGESISDSGESSIEKRDRNS